MKLVCLGGDKTRRRCWHFVPMLLLLLFTIASISANQSAANRLVRQVTGSSQVAPLETKSNNNLNSPTQQQPQPKLQATLPSTSPPESSSASTLKSSRQLTAPINNRQQPTKSSQENTDQNQPQQQCEYEKEAWQACQSNDVQERVLRLKRGSKCEPVKIMRRECRIGCKYARGEWSNSCTDGLRVRVDTLIGYTNPNELENLITNGQLNANNITQNNNNNNNNNKLDHSSQTNKQGRNSNFNCQPERKVTKDCRRACHYIKSAWSDCIDGFKTRNLTLDETPLLDSITGKNDAKTDTLLPPTKTSINKQSKLLSPSGSGCIKQKQVRRECRRRELQSVAAAAPNKLTQTTADVSTTAGKSPERQTPAQRRRLKQLQRRQQQQKGRQQQQQPPSASSTAQTTDSSNTLSKGR